MADYTLKQLNDAARSDPKGFIQLREDYYRNQVDSTARELAARRRTSPIVLVNGPSSAGKTTTTARLRRTLEKRHGIRTETISMDDYYRTVNMRCRMMRKTALMTWNPHSAWILPF